MKSLVSFTSRGRVGVVGEDGRGERFIDFGRSGQKSWQLGPAFGDGRRVVAFSLEDTTMSRVIKGLVTSHVWVYDLVAGSTEEILAGGRYSQYEGVAGILPGGGRVLGFAVVEGEQHLFTADLDGGNRRLLFGKGEGFAYGVEASRDGSRVAYHVTGGKEAGQRGRFPYSIMTMPTGGGPKVMVAGAEGHLYFGPRWSPDGGWLAYLDCRPAEDPAHFWSELCLGKPDGSSHRVLTPGKPHWFGTTHGTAEYRMGGSNMTEWSPDGRTITYTRVSPGAHPDAEFHPELPDHEENIYSPGSAKGGAQLCLLDPIRDTATEVTPFQELRWDFRSAWHPEGKRIAHSRAVVTRPTEIWSVSPGGTAPRMLTRGFEEQGADFPKWLLVAE
jgi:Tol biopolymer transport system component